MNYCLYRLEFKTALHIGDDSGMSSLANSEAVIHADTIFSALCHEALQCGGGELLERLHGYAKSGSLRLSDAMPYKGEEYYLPKPIISIERMKRGEDAGEKKALKKLRYIPATRFSSYISYAKGKGGLDISGIATNFYAGHIVTRASIKGNEEAMPYHIGAARFLDCCGLYVIAAYEEKEQIELLTRLLGALSYSGIGGKRTSGFGRFEIDDPIFLDDPYTPSLEALAEMLGDEKANYRMSLSVCLPKDDEIGPALTDAYYGIVRRGGFVQSRSYADTPLKKKTMHMLAAGSCFSSGFEGDIYDVSGHGSHPVYRYGKGIFMGVNI